MPLKTFGSCKTKACKNKVVSANIHELAHHGTRKRSHSQIVAIGINAANNYKHKKQKS